MAGEQHLYIITGGSKGLGEALANELNQKDNLVFSVSRTRHSATCRQIQADLSNHNQTKRITEEIFSQLDIHEFESLTLVNNAGILGPIGKVEKSGAEAISLNLNTNFLAPISLTAGFITSCLEVNARKTVINITSGAASTVYDGWSLYCASKAGLEHFSRCVAKEQALARYPVSIVNVNPGVMDTGMQALIRESSPEEFSSLEKFLNLHLSNQLPSPEKVAKIILKALNEESFVSGETFNVADWL